MILTGILSVSRSVTTKLFLFWTIFRKRDESVDDVIKSPKLY